jgi:hypothetical protein
VGFFRRSAQEPETARPSGDVTKHHWGSESDRGCSSGSGWGRAIQTSGRVDGECAAVGAKCSPRLCKLGQYDLSRGDTANPDHLMVLRGNSQRPVIVKGGFEKSCRCVLR